MYNLTNHLLNVIECFWDVELFVNQCFFYSQFVLDPRLDGKHVV